MAMLSLRAGIQPVLSWSAGQVLMPRVMVQNLQKVAVQLVAAVNLFKTES
jgi:hypothetical protein